MYVNKLDFNRKPHYWKKIWQRIGISLLAIGIALNSFLIIQKQKFDSEKAAFLTQTKALSQPTKISFINLDLSQTDASKKEYQELVAVSKLLNLPWPNLFKALESSRDADIDLISLMPNIETGELQIMGQATSLRTTFKYIENLKKDSHFTNVELNEYQSVQYNNLPALRFTITVNWLSTHE